MAAWASGAWAPGAWTGTAWASGVPVTVPDVVGLTQAQATTDIEAEGLVVSVSTAYSSTVEAGLVISQSPVGGSSASSGSTVSIVLSLGDAPQQQTGSGGSNKRQSRKLRFTRDLEPEARELFPDEEVKEPAVEQEAQPFFQLEPDDRLESQTAEIAYLIREARIVEEYEARKAKKKRNQQRLIQLLAKVP